jgi:hypothetical protein
LARALAGCPIGFVDATNYVKQDVFASIDHKTGRPTYNEEHKPGTGKRAEFCPSTWGGKAWPYEAYNPDTGMVYIPANDNHCGSLEGKVQEYVAGQRWTGVDSPDIGFTVDKDAKSYGEIQAWNVNTGEREWTHLYPVMNWGLDPDHRRRPGVQRHQRSDVPGVRCQERRVAVAVQDQFRDHGAAVVLRGGRHRVYRRGVRLGRLSSLLAAPDQRDSGHRPGRAAGRRDLGLCPGSVTHGKAPQGERSPGGGRDGGPAAVSAAGPFFCSGPRNRTLRRFAMLRPSLAALGLAALVGIARGGPSSADSRVPFALEVENATARVGQPTAVRAAIIPPKGHEAHQRLSPPPDRSLGFEDSGGVQFADEVVIGTVQDDGRLVFRRPQLWNLG